MEKKEQIIPREEQETVINIDYEISQLRIYTNRASVTNRIIAKGYEPTITHTNVEGEEVSWEWHTNTNDIPRFLKGTIFRFSSKALKESDDEAGDMEDELENEDGDKEVEDEEKD